MEVHLEMRRLYNPAPLLVAMTSYSKQDLNKLASNEEFDGYPNKPLVKNKLLVCLRPRLIKTKPQ
ncbi:MAG: hypothetical protein A2508_02150 [Candidatus Lambdaproteobacteria bacterium RIFOXYD12_FULL_49_8]|uniref:Response regulatory domain-containing protein n=1 Tax=Candidatus Lambdaproteobacteria bacterium RIFOXYD2_FULL_50_16 TaxID=1817772 RepID=A0A1F6GEK7_9PROT|nr:MAG: hypothetical protein A2527_01240 [Candidatus Lambdaproteobacteria bacterium RIFOXYD2_FULL_50_16]OGG97809.1 MAG: hypothetical protein A2508_02150 [Candidatus Lambdaproteobacteria bacterium RIFOXYD12_FULL_49_8]